MTDTPRLEFPEITDQQDGAESVHNDGLRRSEALFAGVLSRLQTPPGSPAEGDAHIVLAGGTGAFTGFDDRIAFFTGGVFDSIPQVEGTTVYIANEDTHAVFDGSAWLATHGHQVLVDAATVSWDAAIGAGAQITFGGNRTMAIPDNLEAGRRYALLAIQDAVGTRVPTWNARFLSAGGGMPTLTTTALATDMLEFYCPNGLDLILTTIALDVKA